MKERIWLLISVIALVLSTFLLVKTFVRHKDLSELEEQIQERFDNLNETPEIWLSPKKPKGA